MPDRVLDVRRAFEAVARIVGEKERVEIVVRSIKKRNDGETAGTGAEGKPEWAGESESVCGIPAAADDNETQPY